MLLVTTVVANPTPANIDSAMAAINAGTASTQLIPKPNYNLDGEQYQWADYLKTLADLLKTIDEAVQRARPYFLLTRQIP